ncbi:MAG: hypothetical protein FJW24_03015 [Acidimicrobiia bacterium]|nr:hypothetical protein [Acidimicrobiia bacterium]
MKPRAALFGRSGNFFRLVAQPGQAQRFLAPKNGNSGQFIDPADEVFGEGVALGTVEIRDHDRGSVCDRGARGERSLSAGAEFDFFVSARVRRFPLEIGDQPAQENVE